MVDQLLTTKLYVPQAHPNLVPRPRLSERLEEGIRRKLTLICAPAGFGKTTLLSEWLMSHPGSEYSVAWVSLEEADNDPVRFLSYLIAALQTIEADIGEVALLSLRSPQPPPVESVLTALINEIVAIPDDFALVLDDYHGGWASAATRPKRTGWWVRQPRRCASGASNSVSMIASNASCLGERAWRLAASGGRYRKSAQTGRRAVVLRFGWPSSLLSGRGDHQPPA